MEVAGEVERFGLVDEDQLPTDHDSGGADFSHGQLDANLAPRNQIG